MNEQVKSQGPRVPEFEIPASVREMAETSVDQAQQAYTQFKDASQEAIDQLDKSSTALKDGTVRYNQKAIEFTQANVNASFVLARKLLGAKDLSEAIEMQVDFARKQAQALSEQAKDLVELSQKVAQDTAEPIKSGVEKTIEKVKTAAR